MCLIPEFPGQTTFFLRTVTAEGIMADDIDHGHRTGRGTIAGMIILLAAVFAGQFLLAGGVQGLVRPLWFDEILTQTLVADDSLSHSLAAIADGVDFNPPTLHLLLRGYCTVWGEANPAALRSFSLACAFLALIAVFLTLTSVYRPLVAIAATLGMWSGEILIAEAFQARFYSVWAALIAWFCFLLTRSERSFLAPWHFVLRAILSVLICTIHYFGVFSFVLVIGAFCAWNRAHPRRIGALIWSAIPGPIVLLACTPIFLGQRAALTVPTWVPPTSLSRTLGVISMLLPTAALSLCAIALFYIQFLPRVVRSRANHARPGERLGAGVSLASLILMPVILLFFSLLVQPSMIPRYAIVTCLAFAPLMAFLLDPCPRFVVVTCLTVFALAGVGPMVKLVNESAQVSQELRMLVDAIHSYPDETPVIIEDALDALPMHVYAPELRKQAAFLDFEVGELESATPYAIVNRDVLRRYTKHYPGLQLAALSKVRQFDRFLVIRGKQDQRNWSEYGAFRVDSLGGRLYLLVRQTVP